MTKLSIRIPKYTYTLYIIHVHTQWNISNMKHEMSNEMRAMVTATGVHFKHTTNLLSSIFNIIPST